MSLKIAVLAPVEEDVPPKKYGGTERVVYDLVEELVNLGHRVDLYATGTSTTSARLVPVLEKSVRAVPRLVESAEMRDAMKYVGMVETLRKMDGKKYDVIHNNFSWRMAMLAPHFSQAPVVTTHHSIFRPKFLEMHRYYPGLAYVSISNNQRKGYEKLKFLATVYNGLNLETYTYNDKPENFLFFLGRMSPDKGPVEAIKIARLAKRPLIMAAKIDPTEKSYYEKNVKPLIDGRQIKYIGELNDVQKVKWLRKAAALVTPINWEEPFGLVMIEAMACGTPALAFARGAAPEIILPGKTGFLVKNVNEAAGALKGLHRISRSACRARVEKNFTSKVMAANYVKVYEKAIKSKK